MLLDKSFEYFQTFSEQDSEGLRSMFSDDVILHDWDIIANGIDEVVQANQDIFDSVDTIVAEPLKTYIDNNVVITELKIIINEEETLLVTDIIEFNEFGKIKFVRAYKG
tara:strand:+ start:6282 stop:6608 length:327 start_codon:yes stop_codon:yes gene_type:complete